MTAVLRTEKLGDIAELNPSLAESLNGDAPVSFVPMSAVTADTASTTKGEDRRYSDVCKGYTPFLDGDLLVAKITPCFEKGKIAQARLAHRIGFGSTEFHVVRPYADSADARYLLHFLRQERIRLDGARKMTGSAGQRRVPEHFLAGLQVPVPPLPEQRRIAEVLDRAEALRAKRRVSLAQLDTLTHSIFLDMFGDPMKNERGWKLLTVGQAGRVQLGRQRAPQYQSGKHTRPYVRVANVYEDRLALSDVLSMDFDPDDLTAYRLQHGDILLNEGQSTELVGRTAMWRNEIPDCCFQNTLVRFQANRETTLPEFALALFLHYFRSGEFARISSKTSNVAHLGAGRFAAMPFPLPPIELQRQFAARIGAVERIKVGCRASLTELDTLFASLQHRAFRGEL